MSPLANFSPATREWFAGVFPAPTPVQAEAWAAIARGEHALVVAPTGSGKTLAAFLSAIDRLATAPKPSTAGTTVVYVSPLKALGVDIERNLRAPLTGIRLAAERLGMPWPDPTVGVRSGDTTAQERAALLRRPPDILITTPESLYLMLTSSARRTLAGAETVIVDEIHAVAGTKRGSHLALSLERLDLLTGRDVQRVALSATVRPIERVAAFLGGDRAVTVVAPPAHKSWDVTVRTAVDDLTDIQAAGGQAADDLLGLLNEPQGPAAQSIWPHVERDLYEAVKRGRSTLVFTNGRRTAERITGRLNEMWAEEHDPASLPPTPARPPAQVMAPVDTVRGAPQVIARAHHGSVSKEQRAEIEEALKSGELKCVVATSSLELGIDMGAVERVIQIGAPPSVASALQRIGRAGHVVGATSVGEVYPLHRGDLAPAVVATERMLEGGIEEIHVPRHPLDVLAQQTVAAAAAEPDDGLAVQDWLAAVTRAQPYAELDPQLLDAIVELLTGAYPSADFGNLRARLTLEDGRLFPRPGALRLAVTSGGTIPDRGMFGVFLAGEESGARRVGELDEEMVHESRVGDVFTLGASSWRVAEITRDRVLVTPAPGNTGRLPFWRGEDEGRPAELGRHIGRLQREATRDDDRLRRAFVDANTRRNLAAYLAEQRQATGTVPDEHTVVVERFRDELGDWRVVVHSPLGRRVLGAWALVIGEALSREMSVDATPVAGDDGIVLRLPDSEVAERVPELVLADPDDVRRIVVEQVGGTALFAARFRECAARALLLPRPMPGRRAPLWQQRQRAAQLLEVARHHPRFPIILETVREVTQDAYDLPGLIELMRGLRSGKVRLVEVVTESPSPFAATLLFRYPGEFIYDGDTPLAERRAAMLSLDPELLAAALGTLDLREVLDPDVVTEVVAELQHADLPLLDRLRLLGPQPGEGAPTREIATVTIAGRPHQVAAGDLGLLRDALGIPVPAGYAAPATEGRDALTQLVARYARTHGPFTAHDVAAAFGLGVATVELVLQRERAAKRLITGYFTLVPEPVACEERAARPVEGAARPTPFPEPVACEERAARPVEGLQYINPDVLRRMRMRSLAKARSALEPVSQAAFARFLAASHHVDDRPVSSADEVLLALQRLAGAVLPASAWETHVLPARLRNYQRAHLDELLAEGEVVIRVRGSAGPNDPLIALVPADDLDLLGPPDAPPSAEAQALAERIAGGDGTFASLEGQRPEHLSAVSSAELADELWRAAEEGAVAPASMAPVRARVGGSSRGAHKARRPSPRRRARLPRPSRALLSGLGSLTPPLASGRWYRVHDPLPSPADAALALASSWLERFGVITRGGVTADGTPGGFAAAYRLLAKLEESGKMLRGYLVDGLGGAQFSTREIIDQLRSHAFPEPAEFPEPGASELARTASGRRAEPTTAFPEPGASELARTASGRRDAALLAALDPANPYGSILPWPTHPTARPSRAAGALVVLADGECIAHLTRGGRMLTLFGDDDERRLRAALTVETLQHAIAEGRMERVRIEEIDGERVAASGLEDALLGAGAKLTPRGVVVEAPRA